MPTDNTTECKPNSDVYIVNFVSKIASADAGMTLCVLLFYIYNHQETAKRNYL